MNVGDEVMLMLVQALTISCSKCQYDDSLGRLTSNCDGCCRKIVECIQKELFNIAHNIKT